jgi:hypothetical protein
MDAYSKRLGRSVTREELAGRLKRGGPPDEFRTALLDVNGDMITNFARRVAKAVAVVSPYTKVGLMHGCPSHHSAEGRDWNGTLEALRNDGVIMTRPPLGGYGEDNSVRCLSDITQHLLGAAAIMPEGVVMWPEMESAPYSEFNKSISFTRYVTECTLIAGTPGCTFNVYDMIGNGVNITEPGLDVMFGNLKPYMEAVAALGLSVKRAKGVCVPIYPEMGRFMMTDDTGSLFNMMSDDQLWRRILPIFGASVRSTTEKTFVGETVAFSGQSIKCLTPAQTEAVFRDNFVLLDGGAVLSLADMGLLRLAGVKSCERVPPPSPDTSYEEVVNGVRYKGIDKARIPMYTVGDYVKIVYETPPEEFTVMKRSDGSVSGPGTVISRNCFIWPCVPNIENVPPNLCNMARQGIIQEVLERRGVPMSLNYAAVALFAFDGAYIVVNASQDDRDGVELFLPGVKVDGLYEVDRKGQIVKAGVSDLGNGRVGIGAIPRVSTRTFIIR